MSYKTEREIENDDDGRMPTLGEQIAVSVVALLLAVVIVYFGGR